jgi:hypothetical protein
MSALLLSSPWVLGAVRPNMPVVYAGSSVQVDHLGAEA